MAAIANDDVSINAAGDIRWTGVATTPTHTILEFIQFLMDKQDDEQAAGDDLLDITVDTPFDRSTDQIVSLNFPFNIDDTFARHLFDGSVSQTDDTNNANNTLYSGLNVLGPVATGTSFQILQDGKILPNFWGVDTFNPETAPSLVFARLLVKSRAGGVDIDGKRVTVMGRELGDQFRRFPATLGTGNTVAAIGNGADIFNAKTEPTIAAFTDITNTEGFQQIDMDGNGIADGDNEYYSQWTDGVNTTNDIYERAKWISQRSRVIDTNAELGDDFIIDDAGTSAFGLGFEFIAPSDGGNEILTGVRVSLKVGGGTPTGFVHANLYDSDDATPAIPTGAILGRSQDIAVTQLTSTYEDFELQFDRFDPEDPSGPGLGAQWDTLDLVAGQTYFIVLHNDEGTASDFIHAEGDTTSADPGNLARETVADTTWVGATGDQLQFDVRTSFPNYGIPGDRFEGINIEANYTAEGGTGVVENQILQWGTQITYNGLVGTFRLGEYVVIRADGDPIDKNGGKILADTGTVLLVALDNTSSNLLTLDDLVGITSGATADINVTIVDDDLSGGEGLLLALDDNTGTGEVYLQVLSGVAPVLTNIMFDGAGVTNSVTAGATLNTRTLIPEYVGTSTGSNIIGAYGVGYVSTEVGSSDRFEDLSGSPRTPPNNVTLTVSGLATGEDRVLIGPRLASALGKHQWEVGTALTTVAVTALVVQTGGDDTVPWTTSPTQINWPTSSTAGAGTSRVRVERDNGIYQRLAYDSHDSVNTFTLGTADVLTGGAATLEVSQVGGTGGQFDYIAGGSGSFITDGFHPGMTFTTTLFTNGGNNSQFTALSVTATALVVTDYAAMVNESAGGGNETMLSDGWNFLTTELGEAAQANDVFLSFIDVLASGAEEAFTGVHEAGFDRLLFVRVRDGGGTPIKTFEAATVTFTAVSQTIAAVRTTDA